MVEDGVVDTVITDGIIRDVAGLSGILPAAEMQLGEILLDPLALGLGLSQDFIELLDVAHGPAGVADGGTFHLIRNRVPLRVPAFQLGHHPGSNSFPRRGSAAFENLNGQVVDPPAGVKPGSYRQLLLGRRIDSYLPRLLPGSAGVHACGS